MRTHHQVLDVNKDGVVSWDDFETLIVKFKELGHLTPQEVGKFTDALRVRFTGLLFFVLEHAFYVMYKNPKKHVLVVRTSIIMTFYNKIPTRQITKFLRHSCSRF